MSLDYNKAIGIRFTEKQWSVLDVLAEPHRLSRSSYIRTCIFSKRPPFTTDQEREMWEEAGKVGDLILDYGATKVTEEQKGVLDAMVKDAGFKSTAAYVRECIFRTRPKVKNSSVELARIRAGRCEKTPFGTGTLRRIGRVLQGAIAVRCNKNRHQITLTLADEDFEYLSRLYRWEELKE